ncbi:MAG: hypothetical protein DRO10_01530, partial [Thermoprotei archaeon]
ILVKIGDKGSSLGENIKSFKDVTKLPFLNEAQNAKERMLYLYVYCLDKEGSLLQHSTCCQIIAERQYFSKLIEKINELSDSIINGFQE